MLHTILRQLWVPAGTDGHWVAIISLSPLRLITCHTVPFTSALPLSEDSQDTRPVPHEMLQDSVSCCCYSHAQESWTNTTQASSTPSQKEHTQNSLSDSWQECTGNWFLRHRCRQKIPGFKAKFRVIVHCYHRLSSKVYHWLNSYRICDTKQILKNGERKTLYLWLLTNQQFFSWVS